MKSKGVLLAVMLGVVLGIGGSVGAGCPSMDLTGDFKVNLADLAVLAGGWQNPYDVEDLSEMASEWLEDRSDAFITTWDTRLGAGTTVTLALAGTVDAMIDWGGRQPCPTCDKSRAACARLWCGWGIYRLGNRQCNGIQQL